MPRSLTASTWLSGSPALLLPLDAVLEDGLAAVDREHLSSHPRGLVRGKEQDAVCDVLGRAEAPSRDRLEQPALALLAVTLVLRDRARVRQDEARGDRVDGDPERAELVCRLSCEAELTGLCARVCLNAREAHAPTGARRDVDDPPMAPLLHPGRNRTRADEGARQVRVDNRPPVLVRHLFERPSDLPDD